jgi:putative DNA polymerase III, delta subunit
MIYFIGGKKQREFKYFEILEKIRKENVGISESFFDADLKENEKFLEKININSIFSSQELVVLKRAEKLKNIEEILKYIANLEIVNKEIVIDYDKEDGKFGAKLKRLLDELGKNKKMKVFLFQKETEEEIRAYVIDELEINGGRDLALLLEMIGNNPFKVRNEVAKIKIFLNGEKFDIEKIKNVVSVEKEYRIYEMTRNILLNKPADVMGYLEQKKEYMGILYSLYSELETMYKISSLKKRGRKFSRNYNAFKMEFEEIKEVFKSNNRIPNSYVIFKKLELEQNYTNLNLKKLVFRCWEIEREIKTGKIEMETGVEILIMEICSLFRKK